MMTDDDYGGVVGGGGECKDKDEKGDEDADEAFLRRIQETKDQFEHERHEADEIERTMETVRDQCRAWSRDRSRVRDILLAQRRLQRQRDRLAVLRSPSRQQMFARRVNPLLMTYQQGHTQQQKKKQPHNPPYDRPSPPTLTPTNNPTIKSEVCVQTTPPTTPPTTPSSAASSHTPPPPDTDSSSQDRDNDDDLVQLAGLCRVLDELHPESWVHGEDAYDDDNDDDDNGNHGPLSQADIESRRVALAAAASDVRAGGGGTAAAVRHVSAAAAPRPVVVKTRAASMTGGDDRGNDDTASTTPFLQSYELAEPRRGGVFQEPFLRLFQRYFCPQEVTPRFVQRDECPQCRTPLLKDKGESQLVCPNRRCGISVPYMDTTSEALAYGEEFEIPEHVYERFKHFATWLSQFRRGTPIVPDHVIIKVDLELRKVHDKSYQRVRPTPVRHALRRIGLPNYCPVHLRITHRLNNLPIAEFNNYECDRIKLRFQMVQVPFLLLKDIMRKNFMNFSFCVNKFVQMDGWFHFMSCFPLMKTRKVIQILDMTLQRIVNMLQSERSSSMDPVWISFRSI